MIDWLKNKSVLVTGATGLIGSAVVELLLKENANQNLNAHVVAACRSLAKLQKRFANATRIEFLDYDATEPFAYDGRLDLIIHAASPASPDLFMAKPVETMMANIIGINELLKYAVAYKTEKVVYVSSGEVYGKAEPRENGFREEDSGYVDILSPRSSYPMGKRAAETLCASYASEYGVNVSIVRPGHIYGPTATKGDRRVSSMWPRMAARGEALVLKSSGSQVRSYTHCYDCATAILAVAERGLPGEAYNIANRHATCSIREIAEIIAHAGGVDVVSDAASAAEKVAFNPMDNAKLDPSKLEHMGWKAVVGKEEGFDSTVKQLKERI